MNGEICQQNPVPDRLPYLISSLPPKKLLTGRSLVVQYLWVSKQTKQVRYYGQDSKATVYHKLSLIDEADFLYEFQKQLKSR